MSIVSFPRQPIFEPGISSEEILRRVRASGGKSTDGVVELAEFERGWAKACFTGELVHFWRRVGNPIDAVIRGERLRFYPVLSLCGLRVEPDEKRPLFGGGNFTRCKRCAAKARR